MKRIFLYIAMIWLAALAACSDEESFTTNPSARLSFSVDTVLLDTVFSGVGSSTYTFWVYNQNHDGIRLSSVRLCQGNQTGFRVNVDGTFLDNQTGAVARDMEVRQGDSLRVFVELTAPEHGEAEARLTEDDLEFTLESGLVQRVNLRAFSLNALKWNDKVISRDTLIESALPILVYGGLRVDSSATLTIRNTQIYFHDGAGIDVYGRLVTDGVLLRGDRLDHMFDYLPYDRVSGQWRGVRFHSSSTGNVLERTEIRSAMQGVVCDSVQFDSSSQRLYMGQCTVHNCRGEGLLAYNSYVGLYDCQFSNTEGDCVAVYGGAAVMLYCTIAQFYPFASGRGAALRFANYKGETAYPLYAMNCGNTLITGYDADVVMGESRDSTVLFDYYFYHCLLRTPSVADTTRFEQIIWETPDDSIQGKAHFRLIDEQNLSYDFRLDSLSTARGMALPVTGFNTDRNGIRRKERPDIGCYEFIAPAE